MPRPAALHVIVHASPQGSVPRQRTDFAQRVSYFLVSPDELTCPFAVTFEQAFEHLAALPRLFIEPDGSFVWVSERGGSDWQIDGQLHDSAGGLMTIELKLAGSAADWRSVLRAVGWPDQAVIYQVVQVGLCVPEDTFQELLGDLHY